MGIKEAHSNFDVYAVSNQPSRIQYRSLINYVYYFGGPLLWFLFNNYSIIYPKTLC